MAPVIPFLAVGGAIASAGGALLGAQAQGQNAAFQSAIARNNAIIEGYKAVNAVNAGRTAAENAGLKTAQNVARLKTALGASNVDVNSGSAVNAAESEREVGLLGEATTEHNAELQAYGYRVAGQSDQAQSQLYKSEAAQAPIAGILGAAGSLLGSARAFAPSGLGDVNSILGGGGSSDEDQYFEPTTPIGSAGIGAA